MNSVNVNDSDVTILWHLKSYSHKSFKDKILSNIDKLSEEELLAFTFTAVLGDGYADVEKLKINGRVYEEAVVKITMSDEKYKAWEPLLMRLKGMGFNWSPVPANDGVVDVRFYGGNAINLARAMINALPQFLRDVFDALNFDKWERIKRIAEMEVKFRRGEMQVVIAGYGFTVDVQEGTVALEHKAKDDAEVKIIVNTLRARYGDEFHAYVNRSSKYLVIRIPMRVFRKYEDIKAQVIKVLCKKLEKAKDERRRQIITKHLMRLTTPTKGAAAANHPNRGLYSDQA